MIQSKQVKDSLPFSLLEPNKLLVCVLDFEGDVVHSNSTFNNFFSLFAGEKPYFFEFFNDYQKLEIEALISELIGKPKDVIHYRQICLDSLVAWEFSFLKNSEGDFLGILGVGAAQNESENLSKKIGFNVSVESDIYIQLNSDWEIQFSNSPAEVFFGIPSNILTDKKIWQVFPDSKIYEYALEFKKAKESGSITVIDDFISENGKWYQIIIHPRIAWMDIYFKDISEMQLLGNELSRLDSTLEAILNNSDQAYILMSQDLRIVKFNENASNQVNSYLGKSLDIGQKFLHFLLPGLEDKVLKNLEAIIGGNQISFEQSIFKKGNYDEKLFQHEFFPVINIQKKVIGFVYCNKQINGKEAVFARLLDQHNVLKEILFNQSMVLRSPLSSILGLLELLDKKQLDRENQKYLSYLKVLATDLDQVIRKNTKTINESDSF